MLNEEIKGENAGEGADGFRLRFVITKNKTFNTSSGGGYISYNYVTGMNWLSDLIQIALSFNYIRRVNNVTYELLNLETGEVYNDVDGQPLRGKKTDLVDYIIDHADYIASEHDQSIAGIFWKGNAVCAGYAGAVQYLGAAGMPEKAVGSDQGGPSADPVCRVRRRPE